VVMDESAWYKLHKFLHLSHTPPPSRPGEPSFLYASSSKGNLQGVPRRKRNKL
jgi:hypothetical protein